MKQETSVVARMFSVEDAILMDNLHLIDEEGYLISGSLTKEKM